MTRRNKSKDRLKLAAFLTKIENLQWLVWIVMIASIILFGYFHFFREQHNWFWISSSIAAILYFPNNKSIKPLIRSCLGILWTFTIP